jgi:aryl-alcohol dehydrogenase-like predicted oxidoreductase
MPCGLLDLEATGDALDHAQRQGVGVIARGCFGGGLLKESLTEAELKERTEKWPQVLEFRKIAAEIKQPIMEMALQFALAGPSVSVAILGMHSCKHVEQNLKYAAAEPMGEELWLRLAAVKPATA